LASIPAWEEEEGHLFLIHGQSIYRMLVEAVGATDQENGKRTRSGTVPPRATTPSYVPGVRSATDVTPAVRPGSSLAKSAPSSKRPKLGDSGSRPAPLGTHRGMHAVNGGYGQRHVSPMRGKTPSSLPRPVGITKMGSGHQQRVTSNSSSYRYGPEAGAKKASRARRESFKPRPSVDENRQGQGGGGGRWGFRELTVKEEDEY
jgi:protein regulator of cytokinesis 1